MRWIAQVSVALWVLLLASNALAGFTFNPAVTVTEQYDDNIFLSASDEESDFITEVIPSIQIDYRNKWVDGGLNYALNYIFYSDNSDLNETSLSDTQRALLELTLLPGRNFFIDITDEYSSEFIDSRVEEIETNEAANRANRNLFEIRPTYRREVRTWTYELDAGFEDIRFDDSEGNDTETYDGGLRIDKRLSSRLDVFTLARYATFNADLTSDYDLTTLGAGFNYALSPGWTLSAAALPKWIDFDEVDDEFLLGVDSELRYSRGRLVLFTTYDRTLEETNDDDGTHYLDNLRLGAEITGRLEPTLELFYNYSDFYNEDREDTVYGLLANLRLNVTSRLSYWIEGTYEIIEFEPQSEEIDRYEAGIGVDYAWRRIDFGAEARYRINESDFGNATVDPPDNDYDNLTFLVSASWQFRRER